MKQQPIVTERVKSQLLASLKKLQKKLIEEASRKYILHKSMHHVLPVTNVVFSKEGNRWVFVNNSAVSCSKLQLKGRFSIIVMESFLSV